jgi:hypothetical protein
MDAVLEHRRRLLLEYRTAGTITQLPAPATAMDR